MKVVSFSENLNFNADKIVTKVLLETSFSKEIRILMNEGQVMKEHKAPFPIIVHILKGEIDFGVENQIHSLKEGMSTSLEGNVPHDLVANKTSIIRLTLSKLDDSKRVENVIKNS